MPESRKRTKKGESGEQPERKRRQKKDPNAPKKPSSAYLLFCSEEREKTKAENPKATFGDLGKLLGAKWQVLAESDKEKYKQLAAADKKRYEEEIAKYQPTEVS